MKIAFIGLGNMGAPMARNLIKAGHQLNLFDLNKTVLAELAELGGQISSSPRDAAQQSELVITMLPAAAHVRSVYLNEDGVLAGTLVLAHALDRVERAVVEDRAVLVDLDERGAPAAVLLGPGDHRPPVGGQPRLPLLVEHPPLPLSIREEQKNYSSSLIGDIWESGGRPATAPPPRLASLGDDGEVLPDRKIMCFGSSCLRPTPAWL